MDYVVVIEQAEDGSYSAYVPDLPGCVSCGDTPTEVRENIKEAVALYVDYLRQNKKPIPPASTAADIVSAA